jgi:hypothetical protein
MTEISNKSIEKKSSDQKKLTHSIYVVELDRAVWSTSKKLRDANPQYRGAMQCFYVGMTSHSPKERFEKHKSGYCTKKGHKISSSFVEKYGLYLRPSIYQHLNPMTKADAVRLERLMADRLKRQGHAVWWN